MQSKVALITGGARGLGLACARRFAQDGARVHVVYRTRNADTQALEREFPERVHQADATLEADLARVVAEVRRRDERLDHAVHAVGEFISGPLADLAPADFRRMFASNTESAFLFARAVLPALRESRGQLVFFAASGAASLRARREAAAYMAAKTALVVLARSLALEEAPNGVRINMVSPGVVAHAHADPDTFAKLEQGRVPLAASPGEPRDLAAAVAWLCSDEARLVTGADLEVAGGFGL
ncbi:MAG TPA: SDR family oxidoreductase [Planctomycetota bacterium]|nr:SDR family oxidoreductase [Planctomycetota bacterium]